MVAVWWPALASPLPLVLYVAYRALGWRDFVKQLVEKELEFVSERGCAACPLFRYCSPLYLFLLGIAYAFLLLAVFGVLHIFLGEWGAVVIAAAMVLYALLDFPDNARSRGLLLALAALAHQALGACALALLWLHNPIVFASVIVADNALLALAAWLTVRRNPFLLTLFQSSQQTPRCEIIRELATRKPPSES